jgi:hypothetical protein
MLMLALLTGCAEQRPPPPATATVAASPTAPLAPTALPSTPTPAPTHPAVSAPRTRLGTFFFYWYNCPDLECDASQLGATPPGWLTPLPRDSDPRDGTAYSSLNYDWFEGELRDMTAVGIDTVFPVSWGDHPHPWFRQDRLDLLIQANGVLERPLAIGMFLDTTAQQAMHHQFATGSYRFGSAIPRLPLHEPYSGYLFYDLHIKGFFQRIPREMWATVEGRPIIITYTALCCEQLELSGELWRAVKAAFARDFGVEPWLILEDTWFAAGDAADLPTLAQVADGRYSWGTALNGPATHTLDGFTVSSVGPGFDNRRIAGISEPRHQSRHEPPGGGAPGEGAFLRASLAAVPAETDLLLLETWNEWPETTGVARAAYAGLDGRRLPESFYMEIVRGWRERHP